MEIKLPMEAFDNEYYGEILQAYEKRLYRESIFPNDNSNQEYTCFNISQLDQGALGFMLGIDGATMINYNFLIELDEAKLEELISPSLPMSIKSEDPLIYKTLEEYRTGYIKKKDGKVLLQVNYSELGNHNQDSSNFKLTHEFLLAFIDQFGNSDLSNIFTSKEAITGVEDLYKSEGIDG